MTAGLLQVDIFFFFFFFFLRFLSDPNLNSEFRRYADGLLGTAFRNSNNLAILACILPSNTTDV
jgi:hypothetical protein